MYLAGVLALAAIIIAGVNWQSRRAAVSRDYHDIEEMLRQYHSRQHPGISNGAWEHCVTISINAHGNIGGVQVPRSEIQWYHNFASEFRRRKDGDSIQTLVWFWDEIEAHSRKGRLYAIKYRPQDLQRVSRQ